MLHATSPISIKLCKFKGSALKNQTDILLDSFRGRIDHPLSPVFLGFHKGNRFKMVKMYEVITAMGFNRLL